MSKMSSCTGIPGMMITTKLFSQVTENDKIPMYHQIASTICLSLPARDNPSSLGGLPQDIWNDIIGYLYPRDLVSLAQVNSSLHSTVTSSVTFRFYKSLFPTSRQIWALSWKDAHEGYFARTVPPTGREIVTFNLSHGNLPQDELFSSLFLGTNRRVIEFFGPSVRHRHDTFLTQTDVQSHVTMSWRITSTQQYAMGQVTSVAKMPLPLPPRGHHLRPAGLDVVGTCLFWVDYADRPVQYRITPDKKLQFLDDIGEDVLWPEWVFDDTIEDPCLLRKLFLSWGEAQFDFSGQMVSAADNVREGGRKQMLRLFDYAVRQVHNIPFDRILGNEGPWLGKWRAPWILPWGFDDDGNLLFKILDTRIQNGVECVRCVQTSFNLVSMQTTFSVEILEDIQLTTPWNFQLFSDQCWGYPAKDSEGNLWCILRDLRDGNLVRRVGPLNAPGARPTEYSCHISMFHVIFQDKSARHASRKAPAYTPLRVFPIKPMHPSIQNKYEFPAQQTSPYHSQLLYELSPPPHPNPPAFWAFGGEDAAERYLFFQGSSKDIEHVGLYDDWKKWAVWDSYRREWTMLQCQRDWGSDGFYCLFSESDGDDERVGLDWVRMEIA